MIGCLGPVTQGAEDEPDVLVAAHSLPLSDDEEVGAAEILPPTEGRDLALRGDSEVFVDTEWNDVGAFSARGRFEVEQITPSVLRDARVGACVLDRKPFLVPNWV